MKLARSAWARAAMLAVLVLAPACPGPRGGDGTDSATVYPPADIYEIDPQFEGEWYGDVDGQRGTLIIGALSERTFYGSFVSEDDTREYTLLLEHTYIEDPNEGQLPSNRLTFTWQDGLGNRGKGWLLIDQSDRALSGSFGFGVATRGLGKWSFIRREA